MNGSILVIQNVSKTLGDGERGTQAIKDFTLSISGGEIVSLFGPNGCGKSTLLSIAAGLIPPDKGQIILKGAFGRRPSPIVFQDYRRTLLPWLSLRKNVLLPLTLSGWPRPARQRVLDDFLAELDLRLPLEHRTYQVSGGQAQLACMCRALIWQAPLLFLDEPFSALDYFKARRVVGVLRRALKDRGVTVLSVSHDIDEAILFSDVIVVLDGPPAREVGRLRISSHDQEDGSTELSLAAMEENRRIVLKMASLAT